MIATIDGAVVSQVPPLLNAGTVTHLLRTVTGGTTDVSVAERLMQDTSLGLPTVRRLALGGTGKRRRGSVVVLMTAPGVVPVAEGCLVTTPPQVTLRSGAIERSISP